MVIKIKQIFNLLNSRQRRNFYFLQIFVVLMALMEIIGVASIIPFMSLVGDMDQLKDDTILTKIYLASGINSKLSFCILVGYLCSYNVIFFCNNIDVYLFGDCQCLVIK